MKQWYSTERIGVSAVQLICVQELEWIFRELSVSDVGIDAHIELVSGGGATGKIIGVQIKTGNSYIKNKSSRLTYYGSLQDLNYWMGCNFPVVIMFHHPDAKITYWVEITKDSVKRTQKGCSILIPEENIFDRNCKGSLEKVFFGGARGAELAEIAPAGVDAPHVVEAINEIAAQLQLKFWNFWIEAACDDYYVSLPASFVDGARLARVTALGVIFPPKYRRSIFAARNLAAVAYRLVDIFLPRADYIEPGDFYQGTPRYKTYTKDHDQHREEHEQWTENCIGLVFELAKAVNLFCDIVREELDCEFFLRQGRFLLSNHFPAGAVDVGYTAEEIALILDQAAI